MSRRLLLFGIFIVGVGVIYFGCFATPPGPRSMRVFDADRVADLEVDMWQAYYKKEKFRLFRDLVTMLHEQNRYPWGTAARAGFYFGRAASRFSEIRWDYDQQVLPDLERAYTIERNWLGETFDPARVARAELAWWVARRIDGQNSPEQVGALIADENALLYGVPRDRVMRASVLRARAGRLRDDGGEKADWGAVSTLLHQSYRELHEAVNK